MIEIGDLLETRVVYVNNEFRRRPDELFGGNGEAPFSESIFQFSNVHGREPVVFAHCGEGDSNGGPRGVMVV